MKRTLFRTAAFIVLCGARVAVAQTAEADPTAPATDATAPDDAELQQAQDHFRRGVLLYQEGNYNGALAEFTRAYQAVPNYRVLYNLGQTHAERHDYVEALRLFGEYLRQGGDEIPAPRRQAIEHERSALRERVGTLSLDTNVEGAELFVNGESRGTLDRHHSLQLNPGVNELRLERAGYAPTLRRVTVVGGDQVALDLSMQSVGDGGARVRASVDEERDSSPSRAGLWVSLAATTVLGGAAATFAVLTLQADNDLDSELREYPADPSAIEDTRSRLRTYATATDALTAGAVLGAGAMVYFLLSGPDSSSSVEERGEGAASRGFNAHWRVTGNGLAVSGEF